MNRLDRADLWMVTIVLSHEVSILPNPVRSIVPSSSVYFRFLGRESQVDEVKVRDVTGSGSAKAFMFIHGLELNLPALCLLSLFKTGR